MTRRVNLVAFENGVGNSRDIALLSAALRELGCSVQLSVPSKHARRRRRLRLVRAFGNARRRWSARQQARGGSAEFDLTVMLEHVWPEQLHRARHNVIVPNPEFFDRHDQRMLDAFDAVWAKTGNTLRLFDGRGHRCVLTGFDSEDRYSADVAREPTFLHLAGKSRMKGTQPLLELWARHPDWPRLTVVQSLERSGAPVAADNIRYETRYLTDAELRVLQNRNLFHVCSSETEGWGHYIAEAESVAAIVVATDAPPMNELVRAERGLLVPAAAYGRQHLATTYRIGATDLEGAIERALALDEPARRGLSNAARAWFVQNKRTFPARIAAALAALDPR
jgi:glycosyltransferase involved in cell wall biosynthesis